MADLFNFKGFTHPEWVDAFVMHLAKKPVDLSILQLLDFAEDLYLDYYDQDPVVFAEAEWNEWPPLEPEG